MSRCAEPMTQLHAHSRSRLRFDVIESAVRELTVLQTAVLFSGKHVLHNAYRGKSKHLTSRGLVIGYLMCNIISRTFSKFVQIMSMGTKCPGGVHIFYICLHRDNLNISSSL